MMKKATALLALLLLCGLAPAVSQEPQEEMKEKAEQVMGEAEKAMDKADEMGEKAQEMGEKAEEMGEKAEEMGEKAQEMGEKAEEMGEKAMDKAEEVMEAGATLEEILASHFEAIGGADAMKSIQAVRFEGTMSMGPGMEAPFKMTMQRPENIRLEFTFQGMTGIQSSDGETAWMVMPFMGKNDPEEMPASMADQLKEQADIDGPLFDWSDKGHQVELMGKVKMEGTEAYKVKLTRKNGKVRYHYLDTDYYMVFKQEGKTEIQGQEMEIETDLGDYKELCLATSTLVDEENACEGDFLVLPFSIESKPKGAPQGQAITITSVSVNPDDIAEDYFAMPAKPAAAADDKAESGE